MSTAAATESYAPDGLSQFCEHLKTMLASSIHHQTHHIEDPKEITRVAREMFHVVDSEVTQAIQTVKTEFNRRVAVDRLHDELILEILQYCVPTIGKKIPAAYSVCTRWRLIANSSPSLWTKMQLPMAPEWYSIFLERSGKHPLEVHFSDQKIHNKEPEYQVLGKQLQQLAPRIAHLHFYWNAPLHNSLSLNKFLATHAQELEFPSLETAEFYASSSRENPTIVLRTPALQKLTINGDLEFLPKVITDNVTDFRIQSSPCKPNAILQALSQFPKVEHCDVSTYTGYGYSPTPSPSIISLPKLQDIKFKSLSMPWTTYVLNALDVPPTARIEIAISRNQNDAPISTLILPRMPMCDEFTIRSGPHQECMYDLKSTTQPSLCITGSSDIPLPTLASSPNNLTRLNLSYQTLPSSEHLAQSLTSWSSLTSISIWAQEPDFDRFLVVLSSENPAIICPQLERLDCTETKFTRSRMYEFLEFRKAKGVGIRELKSTKGFSTPDTEGFASLVERHLEVDPEPTLVERLLRDMLRACPEMRSQIEALMPAEMKEAFGF